jgi:UDP-N-acetylenolpyruvoylglucosamine reductase
VLELMRTARAAVAERFGVVLENEVIPIGSLAAVWRDGESGE